LYSGYGFRGSSTDMDFSLIFKDLEIWKGNSWIGFTKERVIRVFAWIG
jgi:hypothetical protein